MNTRFVYRTYRLLAAALAALAVLGLAACGEDKPEPKPAAQVAPAPRPEEKKAEAAALPATPAPAPAEAPKPDPDATLAAAVKAALEAEKAINAQGIDVTAKDGVVTLWGTVAQLERRVLAVKTARAVPGVKSVQNNLQVVKGS